MKIVATSDIHGKFEPLIQETGDLLIVAGDFCPNFYRDKHRDAMRQGLWLEQQFYPLLISLIRKKRFGEIVVVPGNHDRVFEISQDKTKLLFDFPNIHLLIDEQANIGGLKIFGSPWSKWFYGHHWAFNLPEKMNDELTKKYYGQIPENVDILVSHGPALGILDMTERGERVGCPFLLKELRRIKPRLHIFGHIHEDRGVIELDGTIHANVCYMDLQYAPRGTVEIFTYEKAGIFTHSKQ